MADSGSERRESRERSDVKSDTGRRRRRESQERKERKQAQSQAQQAQRLESLGQLAGGVAHDFNNLLAVILSYASFISEELATPSGPDWPERLESVRGDLGQITLAAERAASLTRQLLAFARREVVRPQVLDLDRVITAVQELLHLAVNARDAMPGGGTLTIDTSNITVDADTVAGGSRARQGRNVRVRISDTGTGMPADVLEHVFEPFFTTKEEGTGTGLGLATVYGILTQAEGQIQIYSEPGTGTTFSITLPVTAQELVPLAAPVSYRRSPKGETVLVVEDEEALRLVTQRIFARNGYHVITAANGPQALDIARAHPGEIHLLVTDVVMPRMLGKEVADKMRAIKPGIEVLFMSGYARPVLASQGSLEPNVALVEKPFSEAELLSQAGQVLDGHFPGSKTISGPD